LNFRAEWCVYEAMFKEVRHAFRMLTRTPGFTVVAALSVALGIGINSALFSFHDAILLRPLPVRDPSAVVTVSAPSPTDPSGFLSYRTTATCGTNRSRSMDWSLIKSADLQPSDVCEFL
jgi:hypothetical protein